MKGDVEPPGNLRGLCLQLWVSTHERDTSGRLSGEARRNRLEPDGPAYGTNRSAADGTRRAQRSQSGRTTQGADVLDGRHEPPERAARTCELSGFKAKAEIDRDLLEWDYGQYEGRQTVEIHAARPDWQLFRDGCPGGESPDQVGVRADRVVSRVRAIQGDVLLFSSGHFLRVLAARWLGLEAEAGKYFLLSTASLSALGYEHNRSQPVVRLWDDTRHVEL